MATGASASVVGHTTASFPRPHVLYDVQIIPKQGGKYNVFKRYSEVMCLNTFSVSILSYNVKFETLRGILGPESGSLPPKRILTTTFIPSAWVDDKLIAERKSGLHSYLQGVLDNSNFCDNQALAEFLAPGQQSPEGFNLEDAVPSTLSKEEAKRLAAATTNLIAASYYPDWSVGSTPPESIDYSQFDLIYFGVSIIQETFGLLDLIMHVAFAIPNSSFGLTWDTGAQSTLQRLVSSN